MTKREQLMKIITDEEDVDKLVASEKMLLEIKGLLQEVLAKPILTEEDLTKYNQLLTLYKKVKKENEEIIARQNLQDEAIAKVMNRQNEIENMMSELFDKLLKDLKGIFFENNKIFVDNLKSIISQERANDRQEWRNNFVELENTFIWFWILLFIDIGLSVIAIIMMFLLWRAM